MFGQDPVLRDVLNDMQTNPAAAQKHMQARNRPPPPARSLPSCPCRPRTRSRARPIAAKRWARPSWPGPALCAPYRQPARRAMPDGLLHGVLHGVLHACCMRVAGVQCMWCG
jgi:hypothetical protein